MSELDMRIRRGWTLNIVRQMEQGKVLTLPDGHRIGMTDDMLIGFLIGDGDDAKVSPITEMTLRELNSLLEIEGIIAI